MLTSVATDSDARDWAVAQDAIWEAHADAWGSFKTELETDSAQIAELTEQGAVTVSQAVLTTELQRLTDKKQLAETLLAGRGTLDQDLATVNQTVDQAHENATLAYRLAVAHADDQQQRGAWTEEQANQHRDQAGTTWQTTMQAAEQTAQEGRAQKRLDAAQADATATNQAANDWVTLQTNLNEQIRQHKLSETGEVRTILELNRDLLIGQFQFVADQLATLATSTPSSWTERAALQAEATFARGANGRRSRYGACLGQSTSSFGRTLGKRLSECSATARRYSRRSATASD